MRLFTPHQPEALDLQSALKPHEQAIAALVEAILSGEMDVDLRLAELVENEQEQLRVAIVEKIREMVRQQSEERAKALDTVIEQQKLLEVKQKKQLFEHMLAYFMSEETLRKIRESLHMKPQLERELSDIGQQLAKKGVLKSVLPGGKSELGGLSANVQQSRDARRQKETDRGL